MTKNLQDKDKIDRFRYFKILENIFPPKNSFLLNSKVIIFLFKTFFLFWWLFYCISLNKQNTNSVFFLFLIFVEFFLGLIEVYLSLKVSSYNKLAHEVVSEYQSIEKMQKEICDLRIKAEIRKEENLSKN